MKVMHLYFTFMLISISPLFLAPATTVHIIPTLTSVSEGLLPITTSQGTILIVGPCWQSPQE